MRLPRSLGAVAGGNAWMRSRSRGPGMTPAERVAALMASFSGPKVWLDPSDVSTLFQDSAGATPVTAAGDGIGRILDKSGAGNHATQTTTPSRPLWQTTYAAFDGTDDSWASAASIDFTSTDKLTVVAAVQTVTGTGIQILVELGSNYAAGPGRFEISANEIGAGGMTFARCSSIGPVVNQYRGEGVAAAPRKIVFSAASDFAVANAATGITIRTNGAPVSGSAGGTAATASNFANEVLNIGRRGGGSAFNGNLYGLIIIGRLLSPDEMWVCERYMAQQAGIAI